MFLLYSPCVYLPLCRKGWGAHERVQDAVPDLSPPVPLTCRRLPRPAGPMPGGSLPWRGARGEEAKRVMIGRRKNESGGASACFFAWIVAETHGVILGQFFNGLAPYQK